MNWLDCCAGSDVPRSAKWFFDCSECGSAPFDMIKNFVLLQHVVSANRGLVFTGAPGLFHSKVNTPPI